MTNIETKRIRNDIKYFVSVKNGEEEKERKILY